MSAANGSASDLEALLAQEKKLRSEAEARSQQLSEELMRAERERQDLLTLCAASSRLHTSLDRADVLAAIQEIVINLIGSEELGVFELSEDRQSLCLISAFGLEIESWEKIPLGLGRIGETAARGEPYLNEKPDDSQLTAVVPLKVDGRLVGALAVFRLLPQKTSLSASDRELIDLLASQGAVALVSSRKGAV